MKSSQTVLGESRRKLDKCRVCNSETHQMSGVHVSDFEIQQCIAINLADIVKELKKNG
jgi:hypothetical protein